MNDDALASVESIEAIDPTWMSSALSGSFPRVEVSSIRITHRIGGTATKARFELTFADARHRAGAPDAVWVKGGFDTRGAHQGEAFANEVNFFRDIAPSLPINLPRSFFGSIDPATRNGVLVLEDLLARDATFPAASSVLELDQVRSVLDVQARLHAHLWESPRLFELRWLTTGGVMGATGMVDQYFETWDARRDLPRFDHVPDSLRDRAHPRRALNALITDLTHRPTCLVHGDSHTANLFFEPDGAVGYLDWQHVMRGAWAFDLANFVITALPVEQRRAHERDLLTMYLDCLGHHGANPPAWPDAWDLYRRYAMWTYMWVLCPPDVHPESLCSRNSERACAAIDDLGSLAALDA